MQTAVDWLIDELMPSIALNTKYIEELKEKAKQLEKQQILDAFDEGQEYEYQYHINNTPKFDSQTYYTETYRSKGSELEQINQDNPITRGSTALVQTTSDKWKEYQYWLNNKI